MKIEQIYTGCLAEATYFISSGKEAAVVDPLRETNLYIDKLSNKNLQLKYIFITHFHADFVSGHVDLSRLTGATIVFGPNAIADFDFYLAHDGEIFNLGEINIKALHTPGHTLESTSFLLYDNQEKEHCIFTGDTLFIGDVGRPDLAVKSNLSKEDLAKMLYKSINEKILTLPDDLIIYPGHGAGSACGKNMSKETSDTLGNQKKINYALRNGISINEFVNELTCGLTSPPQYFPVNVQMNKKINTSFEEIIQKGNTPISPSEFKQLSKKTTIIDCRSPHEFSKGHVPNSLFIGIDGGFAPWAGTVMKDIRENVILVVDSDRIKEAITRLARVGIDNSIGYLDGGIEAWTNAGYSTEKIRSIEASQFENELTNNSLIIDVRNISEYDNGHLKQSLFKPLSQIQENIKEYNANESYYIHCQGGYRSMIACSLLKSKGIHNITDIQGGFVSINNNTSLNIIQEITT